MIDLYVPPDGIVYDCSMGTGTTANACVLKNRRFIDFEISEAQCNYSKNRIIATLKKKGSI